MINQEVPVWRQNPLGEKTKSCSSFTLLQVFQVQNIGTKTGLICNGSTHELFNEPRLRKTKTAR
jgi:hypothetical protein